MCIVNKLYLYSKQVILTVHLHQRHLKSCNLLTLPQAFLQTAHFDPVGRLPSTHWCGKDN